MDNFDSYLGLDKGSLGLAVGFVIDLTGALIGALVVVLAGALVGVLEFFDGVIDRDLINIAERSDIKNIVAMDSKISRTQTKIKILTKKTL